MTAIVPALGAAALLAGGRLVLTGRPAQHHLRWTAALIALAVVLPIGRTGVPVVVTGLAALLVGLYLWVLVRWRGARRHEVDAGMAPGFGIGGDALLRPQRSPQDVLLAHTRGGPTDRAPEVLLLHGLAASRSVWAPLGRLLDDADVPNLRPDLLGFGASRSIGTRFGLDDHVTAVLRLLDAVDARSVVVTGHSFGCAVAVGVAARRPELVRELVLVCPPVFRSGDAARERLGRDDWMARQIVSGSRVASAACAVMCLLRGPAAALVARIARETPSELARESVNHSWPAYRDALVSLLDENPLPSWISHPTSVTTVVLATDDPRAPAGDVLRWPHECVRVVELRGDHLLPVTEPDALAKIIIETREQDSR